ncbi:MAG TPA: hypothetical protein PK024_09730 [Methanospirillum sp.]|uniref:hypothetical protein n=1 Tax=Methanospirillum sp. TaxID=45200 RepID=UPI002C4FD115|nr:hypothetical protein [Methanospirillum sp.]HOJ97098.1 hypothetical protein [Methanospirillum sp.]
MKILDHSLGDKMNEKIIDFAKSKGYTVNPTLDIYEQVEDAENWLNDNFSSSTHCYMMNEDGDWGYFQYVYYNEVTGDPKVMKELLRYILEGENKRFVADCLKLVKKYIIDFDYDTFKYTYGFEIIMDANCRTVLVYSV